MLRRLVVSLLLAWLIKKLAAKNRQRSARARPA